MKQQSTKKQAENRERRKLRLELTKQRGTLCQARCNGCFFEASDMHEVLPRGRGGSATDPDNILLVCRSCHDWIHRHPKEAAEKGLLKSWGAI